MPLYRSHPTWPILIPRHVTHGPRTHEEWLAAPFITGQAPEVCLCGRSKSTPACEVRGTERVWHTPGQCGRFESGIVPKVNTSGDATFRRFPVVPR